MKLVSVIIPVKAVNDYIRESLPHLRAQTYGAVEVLVFPDEAPETPPEGCRVIPSGKVGPAEKRDMALQYARGEIFAFLDDDAYPRADWLERAVALLESSEEIGAVGGPAVTAPDDPPRYLAGGKVYESFLVSGGYIRRYLPRPRCQEDDLPSVNLIVKREVFEAVGGYDSHYWPGEDTKLCLDITHRLGKQIVYDPGILVYHHRRPLFKAHLKQLTAYARHRGYFAKALPETSLRLPYFIPTLFVLGLVLGPAVCALVPALWWVYGGVLLLYLLLACLSIRRGCSAKVWLLALAGIFLSHVGYGVCFVQGLCSKKLLR